MAGLLTLFNKDRELFFQVSTVQPPNKAPERIRELSNIAAQLRELVRTGFELTEEPAVEIRGRSSSLNCEGLPRHQVVEFLRLLRGTSIDELPGTDYKGSAISDAEFDYKFGQHSQSSAILKRVEQRMASEPKILRVDSDDIASAQSGLPRFATFGLIYSVPTLIKSSTAVYHGLRKSGRLKNGTAYFGRLPTMFDNEGVAIPAEPGFVYAVYADEEGFVFDWDWVHEHPDHIGHPEDPELRFSRGRIATPVDTVFLSDQKLQPGQFDPTQAWYSRRGDCVFCYFSEAISFAERINDDLTVFYEFRHPTNPTGFKVKNIEAILEKGLVKLDDCADLGVSVQAILLATFIGRANQPAPDKAEQIKAYDVLISAWRKNRIESPRVNLQAVARHSLRTV